MPTHQQFLDAIAADLSDPLPRLMYADWLEEQGDPMCVEWRKSYVPMRIVSDYFDPASDYLDDGFGAGCDFAARKGGGYGAGYGYGMGEGFHGDGAGNGAGDHVGCFNSFGQYDPTHVYIFGYGDFDVDDDGRNGDGHGDGRRADWARSCGDGNRSYIGHGNGDGGENT